MKERFELFTLLIAKCSKAVRKIKTIETEDLNLKTPHVSCLYYLLKSPKPIPASKLCELCEEDKAYISRSVDYLEKEGLLERISKTEKAYKSPLILTTKGKKIAELIAIKIDKIVEAASQGLSEENRQIFYQSLMLISDNLHKICETYGEK